MRAAIILLCLAVPAFAQQDQRFGHQRQPEAPLPSSCGPDAQGFDVRVDDAGHSLLPPENGKAMVYFIHDDGSGVGGGSPTTRDAVDGSWAGANQGESWFAVAVAPGEHHVCATLQSFETGQLVELTHFNAEAGKSYFFRTRQFSSRSSDLLELEQIDSDEAGYLISLYPMAIANAKK
jgi:hypothetical protein